MFFSKKFKPLHVAKGDTLEIDGTRIHIEESRTFNSAHELRVFKAEQHRRR